MHASPLRRIFRNTRRNHKIERQDINQKKQSLPIVAHITRRYSSTSWGGMETRVLEVCKQQTKNWKPTIFTTSIYESPGETTLENIPIRHYDYHYPYFGLTPKQRESMDHLGGNLISWPLFKALLVEPHLGIIHAHCSKRLAATAWRVAKIRRIPFVMSLHGDIMTLPQQQEQRFASMSMNALEWGKIIGWICRSRKLLHKADGIIAVGRQEYDALCMNFPKEKVHFVPGGVNYRRFSEGNGAAFRDHLQISEKDILLVQVGRIDPHKQQLLSLKMLHNLHEQGIHAHLACIGAVTDPNYLHQLKEYVSTKNLSNFTHFCQFEYQQQILVDAFHAGDILLQPSLHEPFGLTVLEAFCAPRPVLASNVGGLNQLVKHCQGEPGLPPHDLNQWTARCKELIQKPKQRNALAQRAHRNVLEHYLWTHCTNSIQSIYNKLRKRKVK